MRKITRIGCFLVSILLMLSCGACGSGSSPAATTTGSGSSAKASDSSAGTRDSTPKVLTPSADGTVSYECDVATIDASNSKDGYIMVDYHGTNEKVKLQLSGTDGVTYTYNLHGGYETFPLTSGNGSYTINIFENVSGDQYSTAMSQTIDASIANEFGPYLYPNQYVNFTADMKVVDQSAALADGAGSDLDVISNVYNYIIDNFTYDYDKASSVQSGYLPVVDDVLEVKSGICFDYAAVMASMLRIQGIPTRLEVGYMGDVYHAWISTYIEGKGWINGVVQFDGQNWKMMDPTFASTSSKPSDFITEDDKYTTQYIY